jgi:hypothetical protein
MKTMRAMLRLREARFVDLYNALNTLGQTDDVQELVTHEELSTALSGLLEKNWLVEADGLYTVSAIDRTGAFNIAEDTPPAQNKRRLAGLDRLNSFWDKVSASPAGEDKDAPASAPPKPRRASLFDEVAAPSADAPGKIAEPDNLSVPKQVKPSKRDTQSGISKIFDELAAAPDEAEALKREAQHLVPPKSGRMSKLFEELARKDDENPPDSAPPTSTDE